MFCDKILRKLDHSESSSLFINDLSNITKLFKLESEIDYFENLNLFKESIQKWLWLHPFLRAKIEKYQLNHYFVDNGRDNYTIDNIAFYCVESFNTEKYEELLNLFLEIEANRKINPQGKLFRLKIFKPINNKSNSKFIFNAIFTVHHSITEGRNMYFIFLQLLDIFESSYLKSRKYDDNLPNDVLPSMQDLFIKNENTNMFSNTSFISSFKRPSFAQISDRELIDLTNQNILEKIKYLKIYLADEKKNISIENLIEDSRNNQSKFKFIKFEQIDLFKLTNRLKSKKIKMQAFLNMIFSFGIQKVYKNKGNGTEKEHSVVYGYAVNLRKYFLDNTSVFGLSDLNENMGVHSNIFVSSLRENIDFNQNFSNQFWINVQRENDELLERLDSNEQFKIPHQFGNPGDICFDFVLSNIGIMASSFSKESLHQVTGCWFTGVNEIQNKLIFSYFLTIENTLYWSFLFNSFVISEEIAELIINNIKDIFYFVIE